MKIELSDTGFDSTLIMINNALHGALNTKNIKEKDKLINRALGAVGALRNLALVWDDEPENNSESNNIIED